MNPEIEKNIISPAEEKVDTTAKVALPLDTPEARDQLRLKIEEMLNNLNLEQHYEERNSLFWHEIDELKPELGIILDNIDTIQKEINSILIEAHQNKDRRKRSYGGEKMIETTKVPKTAEEKLEKNSRKPLTPMNKNKPKLDRSIPKSNFTTEPKPHKNVKSTDVFRHKEKEPINNEKEDGKKKPGRTPINLTVIKKVDTEPKEVKDPAKVTEKGKTAPTEKKEDKKEKEHVKQISSPVTSKKNITKPALAKEGSTKEPKSTGGDKKAVGKKSVPVKGANVKDVKHLEINISGSGEVKAEEGKVIGKSDDITNFKENSGEIDNTHHGEAVVAESQSKHGESDA